jgi:predicted amidohydrolase YtcJ
LGRPYDFLTTTDEGIEDMRVLYTIVDGRIVYGDPDW